MVSLALHTANCLQFKVLLEATRIQRQGINYSGGRCVWAKLQKLQFPKPNESLSDAARGGGFAGESPPLSSAIADDQETAIPATTKNKKLQVLLPLNLFFCLPTHHSPSPPHLSPSLHFPPFLFPLLSSLSIPFPFDGSKNLVTQVTCLGTYNVRKKILGHAFTAAKNMNRMVKVGKLLCFWFLSSAHNVRQSVRLHVYLLH